ncbi:hypothetical protein NEPAR06_0015 [Nematocida parisii]|uniref:uncharacterized protein n=1 Tax=Nematocida parisii (strain ERTm1 / ATCC PRA-289) TaxID=881290 RepID=UPI000264BB9E|nr:uncharacterized protein NEPG_00117 [Nematocida parisii ERTm1]KAI5130071.1 hypothetical protein NEPAR08_1837 [Nematocida parisii]EIJ94596.1 hypothetical protein NEPG_00117 [Nematocida parisii ERTm1]KAI5130459.1 hypothetical protein NEPAR03_2077 [Nematocida parisii]KAI5143081.1 hypothetical protein NEPAR04_1746 [Nematocida parisii]KAI5152894.1 hypothetical protein NEPAR06_0015 [Nematocida parisii]|eukprot:XP_013057951.1 hypothetical protein NEPG_00117 [Nematocida parisii ERTm1]
MNNTVRADEDCGCDSDDPCTFEYLQAYECYLKSPNKITKECAEKITAMKECYAKRESNSRWSVKNLLRYLLNK